VNSGRRRRLYGVHAASSSHRAGTIVVVIDGPVPPSAIPALCDRFRSLLEGSTAAQVVCDVSAVREPDATAIDALARLQLTAARLGFSMRLLHPCQRLRDVLDLAGLGDVLPVSAELRLEASGEPEHWEMLRADEVVDRRDFPV
jgi:ABC-type transporter Mla MlaB component